MSCTIRLYRKDAGTPTRLAVIAPSGKAQLDALDARQRRIAGGTDAKLVALAVDFTARLAAATTTLTAAEAAYRDAYTAWSNAFDEEKMRRDDHCRTMDKLFGLIRAAFPDDAAHREVVVPEVAGSKRGKSDEDDDEGETTTPADNA